MEVCMFIISSIASDVQRNWDYWNL
jgi:hypothetical protein